jgi:lysosomal alpha-mannosidase
MWYAGMKQGNSGNYADDRPSGAYVFRPSEDDASPVATTATLTNVIKGQIVQEVHQQFNDWCIQVVRIYKGRAEIEIEWTVGPIPVDADGIGKEIINRVTMPSLASNGLFYTDSNGRQTLERRRNYRPTWTMNVSEPIASNYYPINSHIYITNGSTFVALVTDRSQGGTSLHDGEIELMVHAKMPSCISYMLLY